jgi:pyruvate dehydrogenase E2 component (dihydrolipoamide acetyltransferase)
LTGLRGSGPRGRITGIDIEKAIRTRPAAPPSVARAEAFEEIVGDSNRSRPHTLVPLGGRQAEIAVAPFVPQFHLSAHIRTDAVTGLCNEINRSAPKGADGTPPFTLTLTDFLVKALAFALQAVPRANAVWSADGILLLKHSDIALADQCGDGLSSPVLASAETKSISVLSNEARKLKALAAETGLRSRQGGSATFLNLAADGIAELFAPLIPPESVALAVGASERHAVETATGELAFVGRAPVALTCDARVLDRGLGVVLLAAFKRLIENPLAMIA